MSGRELRARTPCARVCRPAAWRRQRSGRMRGARSALTVLAIAATSITGCGSDDEAATTSGPATDDSTVTTAAPVGRKAILIKTRFVDFDGKVVAGSLLGDSSFCAGGTLHH